jgi:O-antigen ligase
MSATVDGEMDERMPRSRLSLEAVATAALLLVPGVLTVYFALERGGYFPGAPGLVAAELAIVIAVRAVVARRPFAGVGPALFVPVAALAFLAVWTLASSAWSDSEARALVEYDRVLLYALAITLFGMLAHTVQHLRLMVYGIAAGLVVVCVIALISRMLPHTIAPARTISPERLSHPLSYWNTLGLMAGIGIVLCGHFACSTRDPRIVRVLGAAAVPALASTLYLTFSRGATWAALLAVAVYALVGRPRALISGAIATAPAALIALMTLNPANDLTSGDPLGPLAIETGRRWIGVIALCAIGAGVARAFLLALDGRLDQVRLPDRARRPVMASLYVTGAVAVVVGALALQVPKLVDTKYSEFSAENDRVPGAGSSRLFSSGSNGRIEHWDVALQAYRTDKDNGTGAGTYAIDWARNRPSNVQVQDAHSLYLELLGELGLPALIAVVIALVSILVAFAYRARGPDRALYAALLAAGIAWTVRAGVDWDWEMPATTFWLFALGGAALGLKQRERKPRPPALGVAARALVAAAAIAVAITPAKVTLAEGHYERSRDALMAGDCRTATAAAHDSLAVVSVWPTPYHVIGYCRLLDGKTDEAVSALKSAVDRDPRDWQLRYMLAIAQAKGGIDPRGEAKLASALNPNEPLTQTAVGGFKGTNKRRWRRASAVAPLVPP